MGLIRLSKPTVFFYISAMKPSATVRHFSSERCETLSKTLVPPLNRPQNKRQYMTFYVNYIKFHMYIIVKQKHGRRFFFHILLTWRTCATARRHVCDGHISLLHIVGKHLTAWLRSEWSFTSKRFYVQFRDVLQFCLCAGRKVSLVWGRHFLLSEVVWQLK